MSSTKSEPNYDDRRHVQWFIYQQSFSRENILDIQEIPQVFSSLLSLLPICLSTVSDVVLMVHCQCFTSRIQSLKQVLSRLFLLQLFYYCRITPSIIGL